ncbi:hypothetical protein [Fibrella forsythiae]|uniref:Histone H1 n=1 Tax=Fibrella forsythiae TaxID=2817061 RepID=A0ABS3JME3_9BACT|nr:hypothetical protein [Fibrella forsythiae]MBO0951174.1 hypothetical protein [Fibrella forsythiae]
MEAYDQITEIVDKMKIDVEKARAGNNNAGVRVRKSAMEISKLTNVLRQQTLAKMKE